LELSVSLLGQWAQVWVPALVWVLVLVLVWQMLVLFVEQGWALVFSSDTIRTAQSYVPFDPP
jgi:hypothetical protein